jgi:hypothetical protein
MTTEETRTAAPTDDRRPATPVWLWGLVAASVVLFLTFNVLALLPIGMVLLVAGLVRRLTAASPQDRALGSGLAVAGLALAGVTAAIGLTFLPATEGEVVLDGVHDEPVQVDR